MICDYGCGKEGKYQFKNGRWCCVKKWQSCPGSKKKNSESHRGLKCPYMTKVNERKIGRKNEGSRIWMLNGGAKYCNSFPRDPEKVRMAGEKHSEWMKKNGNKIRKQIKNPSGLELKLRLIVKELYPASEHTYKVLEDRDYDVDNALVENKIAIEYDGYYHFDTEEAREYHKRRQEEIEENGWKFIRYTMHQKFPTKEQVKEDIRKLLD